MEDGPRQRLALAEHGQPEVVPLDRGHDLQRDLAPGLHPVQLRRGARDRLGIIAEQERRLVRARQHPVIAEPHDRQAPRARQPGGQPVRTLADRQRLERAGARLRPELRVGHLGDEPGVARLGLLAEIDLGRASRLGVRPDPDEQEMPPGHAGARPARGRDHEPHEQSVPVSCDRSPRKVSRSSRVVNWESVIRSHGWPGQLVVQAAKPQEASHRARLDPDAEPSGSPPVATRPGQRAVQATQTSRSHSLDLSFTTPEGAARTVRCNTARPLESRPKATLTIRAGASRPVAGPGRGGGGWPRGGRAAR